MSTKKTRKNLWDSKNRNNNSKKIYKSNIRKSSARQYQLEKIKIITINIFNFIIFASIVFSISFFSLQKLEQSTRITKVEINNLINLDEKVIIEYLNIFGHYLFSINEEDIERKLLKMKEIESVQIKKDWPNKFIIEIKENKIVLQIKKESELLNINQNGIKLSKKTNLDIGKIIELSKDTKFEDINQFVSLKLINFIDTIETVNLREILNVDSLSFSYDKNKGAIVIIDDNKQIIFGNDADIDFKINNLQQVFKQIKLNKINYNEIDLRFNSKIILR